MSFSADTLDFLAENRIVNSRDWYQENKPRYKASIEAPMLALAEALAPTFEMIDPLMTLAPKRTISRIWKDMRYSKDPYLFRDVMWLVFRRGKGMEYPAFFFEFSPRGYRYGVGYYNAPGEVMGRIRHWILSDDKRYLEARAAVEALPEFDLEGDRYKRSRHPDAPADKQDWLDRKNLVAICRIDSLDGLFAENLHETLAPAFLKLAPLYRLFLAAHLESLPKEDA